MLIMDAYGVFRFASNVRRDLNGRLRMVLGISLATFTLLHVIINLIPIVTGLVVMSGLLDRADAG